MYRTKLATTPLDAGNLKGLQPRAGVGSAAAPVRGAAVGVSAVALQPRAADQIIEHLITRERVEVFFGLPGGAISPLDDALAHRNDARMVTTRHEADAVFAAAGYARASGKLGVAMVTSGPGALNALNALASAHLEGLPVLLLAGDAPREHHGRGALQEGGIHGLDILHVARSLTKVATELTDPNAALPQLLSVIAAMKRGRQGAGIITCPVNVTRARAPRPMVAMPIDSEPLLEEEVLDRASLLLGAAKRPLIYAGNGVRSGDGPAALCAFAERLQAPVITTPHAKGVFPETHPLSLGIFGLAMHPSAVDFLHEGFDCMIAVGTSLSELATSGWSPTLKPRGDSRAMIQIDVDSDRIGRVYPVDVAIIGTAAPALRSLANRLPQQSLRVFGVRRNSNPEAFPIGPTGRITPQRAIWELQRALPSTTRYTCDSGEHTLHALHYLEIDDPRAFMVALGLASMGSGIGGALGIATARGEGPVVAIAGDGGFAMSLSAIACAASASLPVIFAIINDGRYGMCEAGYRNDFGSSPSFTMGPLDVVVTAQGLGARAVRIDAPNQLLELDFAELIASGPLVLDIQIDREVRMVNNARCEVIQRRSEDPKIN